MIVTSNADLFINVGTKAEKQVFNKGNKYKYFDEDSNYNNKHIQPNNGLCLTFNEEEFHKYFMF